MKLEIAAPRPAPPLTADSIREAIETSAALARMARIWKGGVELGPGTVRGRKGPAFERRMNAS
jgi:hypothetical protein